MVGGTFSTATYCLLQLVYIAGTFFNMFGLFYLLRLPNKLRFHRILLALVVSDLMTLLSCAIVYQDYRYNYLRFVYPSIYPYWFPLVNSVWTGSVYLTVSLAWERYLSIAHPFLLAKRPLLARPELFILLSIFLSFLFGSPVWFCYETISKGNNTGGYTCLLYTSDAADE